MKYFQTSLMTLVICAAASAQVTYEGTWVTTNRPLDGVMTCELVDFGNERWSGHFYGEWQGAPYSYKVDISGPPERLQGKARIDGAHYDWTGAIDRKTGMFTATFGGERYFGSFNLKAKKR